MWRVELVANEDCARHQSFGEAVSWAPDKASPDGYYHFEAVVVTYDPDADSGEEDGVSGESLHREHGGFAVVGGQIVVPTDAEESSTRLWQDVSDVTVGVASYVLGMLVPAAGAQDLTARSAQPSVNYVDTVTELLLFTTQATPIGEVARFKILDGSGSAVVWIESSTNNARSIDVDPSGNIHLANNAVSVDRTATREGIGTTSPGFALDIHGSIPEIELFDESDSTGAHIQYNANVLSFEGNTEQDIVRIDTRAREGSMRISRSRCTSRHCLPVELSSKPNETVPLFLMVTSSRRAVVREVSSTKTLAVPFLRRTCNGALRAPDVPRPMSPLRLWRSRRRDEQDRRSVDRESCRP